VQQRSLFPRLVRPVLVVMPRLLGQNSLEVPFAEDQHVVQALARSVPTYRSAKEFALGERTGVLMIRAPLPANTSSNSAVNLLSRSRIRNLNRAARSPRSMSMLRACWAGPRPVGVGGDAQDVHAAGLDL